MRKSFLIFTGILLFLLFLWCSLSFADTPVGGDIETDTVWSVDNSPYLVTSDIRIRRGAKLTIEPGVVVKFEPSTGLVVGDSYPGGALHAAGTSDSPITFTSANPSPNPGDWKGIYFDDRTIDEESSLEYCKIEYGGASYGANIVCNEASPQITYSLIAYGSVYGVYCDERAEPRINYCNIMYNGQYGVYNNDSRVTIDAINNWWGSASGPSGAGPGNGDAVSEYVYYDPFFTAPVPGVPLPDEVYPDIKANGSDGPITLYQNDTLTITVSLDNNGITEDGDWWLAADTPFGLYFYTFSGWVPYTEPAYQHPLFYLPTYEVFSTSVSWLQEGTYTFYFGVDMVMDGIITWDSLYYDTVEVNITQ